MVARGFRVFLDLKFHDIPNTVAQACAAATRLGVWMLNVHASGGAAMLTAAREAVDAPRPSAARRAAADRGDGADEPRRRRSAPRSASRRDRAAQALRLAQLAQACGLDGVVCSAQEAPALRAALRPRLQARHARHPARPRRAADDQARDRHAARRRSRAGADYLVIGRPITQARRSASRRSPRSTRVASARRA